ncbi:TOBE domain-containing protein [Phaeovulum vinaykumarii]|uniref:Molybdate transport system regulatory protein n=1 Tax=Phaeovulum vinaykumarii TaxID=407234 RepID=A0A1N7L8P4_9RHOB|nr:TOBE domain-containing protein [Phaeovulum vinaykumarii]SIS70196.1 molybdate transport system regulatory protein [Phaeovulum vinaykumarii]SOB99058.1 molybdate transport system regulatory protein [Phaeovulum vinaykumarii]
MTTSATPPGLRSSLMIERSGARMGGDRVALLAAVGRTGSISAAAREVGLSYKAAWDGVHAMNNLFATPLVTAAPGGRSGGGAALTPAGEKVIAAYGALQEGLERAVSALETQIDFDPNDLLWSLMMKTSARNCYRCTVTAVTESTVSAEIEMSIGDGQSIAAVITGRSAAEMGLAPGVEVFALIKSSFVILATGDPGPMSVRNRLTGIVAGRTDGPVTSEILLDLGGDKTLAATITRESAETLALCPGDTATALVKSSHVILALP